LELLRLLRLLGEGLLLRRDGCPGRRWRGGHHLVVASGERKRRQRDRDRDECPANCGV
jgi:hypothetical protein